MVRAWEAPRDLNAADHGNGGWLVDDTVIRTRFDAVTGFDAGNGKERLGVRGTGPRRDLRGQPHRR